MTMSATSLSTSSGAASGHREHPLHTSTGTSNERFGMILFLVSEAIIFGSIFAQYFYSRVQASEWPPRVGLPEHFERVPAAPLAVVLTIFLALSIFTAHYADSAAKSGNRTHLLAWLVATAGLGTAFLVGQAVEYATLLGEGFGINSGIYGSVFYLLTGLHGLHVLVGVLLMIAMFIRGALGHFTPTNHFAVEGTVMYWHLVDLVWFVLYPTLYLL